VFQRRPGDSHGKVRLVNHRSRRLVLIIGVLLWLAAGCGWERREDVALREFPYPYVAGLAMTGDLCYPAGMGAEDPLAARGIAFVDRDEIVHTIGQDAMCSLLDRGRQLYETARYGLTKREWQIASFFGNRLIEPQVPRDEIEPQVPKEEIDPDAPGDEPQSDTPTDGLKPNTPGARATAASPSGPTADSVRLYRYKKYAGRWHGLPAAAPPEALEQITQALLYELKAKGGWILIDVRLGERRRAHDPSSSELAGILAPITEEHAAGRVYVATPNDLLSRNLIQRYLDWEAESASSGVDIHIHGVAEEEGTPWVPTIEELQGVTFYTPLPERTRVFLDGEEISGLLMNPADHTRRASVSIPWGDSEAPVVHREETEAPDSLAP